MRQISILLMVVAGVLVAAGCGERGKEERFYSADSSVCATHNVVEGSWVIADRDGVEPVEGYDSMRVVDTGAGGHPKRVVYYSGEWVHEFQYYSTMQVFSEGHVKGGRKEGRWVSYYPNGRVWSESNYEGGKQVGVYRSMRENGVPVVIGQYSEGMPSGTWEFYDATGELAGRKAY